MRWNDVSQFQFIVGNPPYITYSELAKDEQKYVKENFNTCVKGKFDYCYAFIEKSIKALAQDGNRDMLQCRDCLQRKHSVKRRYEV